MPVIKKTGSIAAGAQVDNVFAGSAFEYLPWPAALELAVNASATGLVATVQTGADVLMEESPVNYPNRFGIYPDDFDLQDVALGGERLLVKLRNPTAGALTYFVTARVTQVG